jgi:hypothetical protein
MAANEPTVRIRVSDASTMPPPLLLLSFSPFLAGLLSLPGKKTVKIRRDDDATLSLYRYRNPKRAVAFHGVHLCNGDSLGLEIVHFLFLVDMMIS